MIFNFTYEAETWAGIMWIQAGLLNVGTGTVIQQLLLIIWVLADLLDFSYNFLYSVQ